jgi:hypothetical protein
MNPLPLRLAGIAPWWVILETTGRRTGLPRRVPPAGGPLGIDPTLVKVDLAPPASDGPV